MKARPLESILEKIHPHISGSGTRVNFVVGVRMNGNPHIGTYLTAGFCFVLAGEIRKAYGVNAAVEFHALDNVSGKSGFATELYSCYMEELRAITQTPYIWKTYSQIQLEPAFRAEFLGSLRALKDLKRISPFIALEFSKTLIGIRIPCPQCGFVEKDGAGTVLKTLQKSEACFSCFCEGHGRFEASVMESNQTYINLTTIYRNIIKEALACRDTETTRVMVKATDWLLAVLLVDEGLDILDCDRGQRPLRVFVPQIVTESGAKLSKSLIQSGNAIYQEIEPWLLNAALLQSNHPDYANRLVNMMESMLQDPGHSFRSYSCREIVERWNAQGA